ncbi:MAG: hypothetical protein ACQCXQ_06945 [Verrucomicrobiales bacterium]
MKPLLEVILTNKLLFDIIGLTGLALVVAAATTLARRWQSWGGRMMMAGAISLFIARLWHIIAPHVYTDDLVVSIGPIGNTLFIGLPPLLLAFGIAGIVWGLWGHDRWLKESN